MTGLECGSMTGAEILELAKIVAGVVIALGICWSLKK